MTYRHTPDGFLSYLSNKLTIALGIDAVKLKLLIERFIRLNNTTNDFKKHHVRVQIFNEITKDKMSIKVFFKKLSILRIKKLKITLTATNYLDRELVVSEEFNLSDVEETLE